MSSAPQNARASIVRALPEDLSHRALLRGETTRVLWSRDRGFKLRSMRILPPDARRRLEHTLFDPIFQGGS